MISAVSIMDRTTSGVHQTQLILGYRMILDFALVQNPG